jgi:hypothetical protein
MLKSCKIWVKKVSFLWIYVKILRLKDKNDTCLGKEICWKACIYWEADEYFEILDTSIKMDDFWKGFEYFSTENWSDYYLGQELQTRDSAVF